MLCCRKSHTRVCPGVPVPSGLLHSALPQALENKFFMKPLSQHKLAQLVQAAQAGNTPAMEQLLHWLRPQIGPWVRRLCDPAVLEDVVQETLFQVFHKLNQLQSPAAFSRWARTIACHTAQRLQRAWKKQRADQESQQSLADTAATPPETAATKEAIDLLNQAVNSLAEPYRQTVQDHLAGLSIHEISLKHGCPVGTVKRRLHTARKKLGKQLEPKLAP